MKKILPVLLIMFVIGCEDEKDDKAFYATAKILKFCEHNADGSVDYCDEWSWNGNTVKIIRDGKITAQGRFEYGEERTYNEYGFVTQIKRNEGGSYFETYNYTFTDKWKVTDFEVTGAVDPALNRKPWTYSWEGNTLKRYRSSNNSLIYENVYDDHSRLIKFTYYESDGSVIYEDELIWDQAYRYRGLSRTRSTYKNVNNPEGYLYKIVWDGDSNVYTRYNSSGSISYTSTQTVNKYDQPTIRTYDDENGRYYTWEYGDAFEPYIGE